MFGRDHNTTKRNRFLLDARAIVQVASRVHDLLGDVQEDGGLIR